MQARDYGARKQAANGDVTKMPAYNQKLEALLPVLAREIPLKAHAHQANDIFTALRIAREFDLRLTLEHVEDASSATVRNVQQYERQIIQNGVLARLAVGVGDVCDG